jgi:hypothetical protein
VRLFAEMTWRSPGIVFLDDPMTPDDYVTIRTVVPNAAPSVMLDDCRLWITSRPLRRLDVDYYHASPGLPHRLPPGEAFEAAYRSSDIRKALQQLGMDDQVKLRATVRDATGREYRSKPLRFDPS